MASNPKARPYDGDDDHVATRIQLEEDDDDDDDDGVEYDDTGDDVMEDAEEVVHLTASNKYLHYGHRGGGAGGVQVVVQRTSELTLSFEGEVYVFPAVTPEKVFSPSGYLFYMLLYLLFFNFSFISSLCINMYVIPCVLYMQLCMILFIEVWNTNTYV